jgi:hypothetical protein
MSLPREKWKKTPWFVAFAGLEVVPSQVLPRRGGGLLHPATVETVASRVVASLVLAGDLGLACSCPNSFMGLILPAPAGGAQLESLFWSKHP